MLKSTSKAKKFFKDLDIFGQPIPLYFDGHALYTTQFGGIITMTIICIILTLIIVLTRSLLTRTNYTTSNERDFKLNPILIDLSNDFMFSIGIQDPNIALNNSIFSYTATYIISENLNRTTAQTKEIELPLHPCTNADYPNFQKEFDQYFLKYTMCPDLTNITIQGQSYSPLYTYLKLNVSKCINGTNSGITCASDDYINDYFTTNQMKRIVLYFISSVADFDNYLNPFDNKFIDELTWIISPDSKLRISSDLYFETSIINTLDNVAGIGNGWNTSAIDYQRFKNDNVFMPDTTKYNEYLEIFIKANTYYTCTVRKYETFPQIISILAGIWNALYLILGQIAMRYNNALFKVDLANVLYNFDTVKSGVNDSRDETKVDKDDDNTKGKYALKKSTAFKGSENLEKQQLDIKSPESKTSFPAEPIAIVNEESQIDTPTITPTNRDFLNKFNALRSKRRILKYSLKDIWTIIFRCCSTKILKKKNLLLHKANTKLASDIDIRIILKKFKEVTEIKNIIFDENQLAIFDFAPPELIALEHDGKSDEIKKIHSIQQTKYLKNQLQNLCCIKEEYFYRQMAYDTCKSRTDIISQNLIERLDSEAKEIFELLTQKNAESISNNLNSHRSSKQQLSMPIQEDNFREDRESIIGLKILKNRMNGNKRESLELMPNEQNHHLPKNDLNPSSQEQKNLLETSFIQNQTSPNQDINLLSKHHFSLEIDQFHPEFASKGKDKLSKYQKITNKRDNIDITKQKTYKIIDLKSKNDGEDGDGGSNENDDENGCFGANKPNLTRKLNENNVRESRNRKAYGDDEKAYNGGDGKTYNSSDEKVYNRGDEKPYGGDGNAYGNDERVHSGDRVVYGDDGKPYDGDGEAHINDRNAHCDEEKYAIGDKSDWKVGNNKKFKESERQRGEIPKNKFETIDEDNSDQEEKSRKINKVL